MTNRRESAQTNGSGLFLVERYLPSAAAERLPAAVARVAQLCDLTQGSGGERESAAQVHYLHSTYLPAENTCFCVFRAATADAVRAVNEQADFALDRITDAVLLHPDNGSRDEPPAPRVAAPQ
jgi:Protein of unknown function (DUF4242)